MADLRKRSMVTKVRTMKTGEAVGGIPFTPGPLAHLLRNRFYIEEVALKGEILKGEQPAIVDRDLLDAVQTKLREQQTVTPPKECNPKLCSPAAYSMIAATA
jgi:site-specific DNA recombinase